MCKSFLIPQNYKPFHQDVINTCLFENNSDADIFQEVSTFRLLRCLPVLQVLHWIL